MPFHGHKIFFWTLFVKMSLCVNVNTDFSTKIVMSVNILRQFSTNFTKARYQPLKAKTLTVPCCSSECAAISMSPCPCISNQEVQHRRQRPLFNPNHPNSLSHISCISHALCSALLCFCRIIRIPLFHTTISMFNLTLEK